VNIRDLIEGPAKRTPILIGICVGLRWEYIHPGGRRKRAGRIARYGLKKKPRVKHVTRNNSTGRANGPNFKLKQKRQAVASKPNGNLNL